MDLVDIDGYEGKYKVDMNGNVYSTRRKTMLRPIRKSTGYLVVSLCGKQTHIHRIVAETFIPNPENKPYVDHINTITTDNRVENLRWCTAHENVNNPISRDKRIRAVRKKLKGKFGKYSSKHRSVYQYTLDGEFMKEWECISDACRYYNIDSGSITKCC